MSFAKRVARAKRQELTRTRRTVQYHGRKGRPVVHKDKSGDKYIMVRHPSEKGVKRLYSGSKYKVDGETKRLKL